MATSTLPSPHSATVPTYLVLYSISRSGPRLHAIQTFHSSIKLLRTLVAVVALSSKTRALRSSHTPLMTCMTSEFAVHRIASGRAATASGHQFWSVSCVVGTVIGMASALAIPLQICRLNREVINGLSIHPTEGADGVRLETTLQPPVCRPTSIPQRKPCVELKFQRRKRIPDVSRARHRRCSLKECGLPSHSFFTLVVST